MGTLADGTRVFASGTSGTLAERALIDRRRLVKLPAGLHDAVAAALPNAVIGAGMALRFRAALQPGETVLINGATGFTGRVAVQLAKLYGAGRVIATGRNPESLQALQALGADDFISVRQPDEALVAQLRQVQASSPIDVIIDYLWGHSDASRSKCSSDCRRPGYFLPCLRHPAPSARSSTVKTVSRSTCFAGPLAAALLFSAAQQSSL